MNSSSSACIACVVAWSLGTGLLWACEERLTAAPPEPLPTETNRLEIAKKPVLSLPEREVTEPEEERATWSWFRGKVRVYTRGRTGLVKSGSALLGTPDGGTEGEDRPELLTGIVLQREPGAVVGVHVRHFEERKAKPRGQPVDGQSARP